MKDEDADDDSSSDEFDATSDLRAFVHKLENAFCDKNRKLDVRLVLNARQAIIQGLIVCCA